MFYYFEFIKIYTDLYGDLSTYIAISLHEHKSPPPPPLREFMSWIQALAWA